MSSPNPSYVLVTGATGFIGAHVVDNLLEKGYKVRGATRSTEKGAIMKAARPQYEKNLDFVTVNDFAATGVFDDGALEDIDAIIHVASPFFYDTTDNEKELTIPALNGVKSLLSAAAKHGDKIQRVVLTSSFASVVDIDSNPAADFVYTSEHWNPLTYEKAVAPDSNAVIAYRASKKFAELAAWDFIKNEKPGFDLVTLCPPMVFGPMHHPVADIEHINESNSTLFSVAAGVDPLPGARVPGWIDVRDLAEAHVQALLRPDASGKRFIPAAPEPFSYEYAADIMKEEFEWARKIVTSNYKAGEKPTWPYKIDGEKVARELGVKYRSFKETVIDTTSQIHMIDH